MRKYSFLLTLCFSTIFLSGSDLSYIPIHQITEAEHLVEEGIIYKDSLSALKLEDFIDGTYESQTTSIVPTHHIPYMDFTSSTYWVSLKVSNGASTAQSFYVELARPLTNVVNFFVLDENNNLVESYKTGDDSLFHQRPFADRKFIFPLTFPAKSKRQLIIQTKSDGEILKLPVKFWRIDAYSEFITTENFFLGLYYGLFILVILLFTFFGMALRQKLYLYFVSYVFFLGLFQFSLDGLAYKYLWSSSAWLGNHAILILAAASMFWMLLYVRRFLEFSQEHKVYLSIYKLFIVLIAICFFLSFSWGMLYAAIFPVLNGLSFIIIFYFLFGIYLKYKEGNRPEIPVTLAFIVLCISSSLFIVANVNVINNEFLAANALKLGSATEVIFLSIAMAMRYRRTQDEKNEAQEIAFKRLEEINQLKSEQTEKLEREVELRTQEIVEKNSILSAKNKEIINSITYAKRLQDAILPSNKLLEACFKDYSLYFKPKDIVSGDFYWVEASKTHVFFAVADCTGHGVPGAMVSVVGHNALNRCINELGLTEPGEILDSLSNLVEHTFSQNADSVSDGMDICLCSWDFNKELKYSGAYNPLYLIRDDDIQEFPSNRRPVGKFDKKEHFETRTIQLSEKDSIVLFSDGFADQFGGPKGKKLKYSNFKKILLEGNNIPMKQFNDYMSKELQEWMGKEEQIDDICILKVSF